MTRFCATTSRLERPGARTWPPSRRLNAGLHGRGCPKACSSARARAPLAPAGLTGVVQLADLNPTWRVVSLEPQSPLACRAACPRQRHAYAARAPARCTREAGGGATLACRATALTPMAGSGLEPSDWGVLEELVAVGRGGRAEGAASFVACARRPGRAFRCLPVDTQPGHSRARRTQ